MASKSNLTNDESWLKTVFRTDFSKLDEQFQENGRRRKDFLVALSKFRELWMTLDQVYSYLEDEKLTEAEQKRAQKQMVEAWAHATKAAKDCDVPKSFAYAIMCKNNMQTLIGDFIGKAPLNMAPSGRNYSVIAGMVLRGRTR